MKDNQADLFRSRLEKELGRKGVMTTVEIYGLFPEMNRHTVSWHLHDELERGHIRRRKQGEYVLPSGIPDADERRTSIPGLSREALTILSDSAYPFYLSGLDCLNGISFRVEGNYPVIVCAREQDVKDVQLLLMRESDLAITDREFDLVYDPQLRSRIQFVVLSAKDFSLQKDCFAYPEKAFVDLYYACTRLEYPLSREELPHILSLMGPNPYRFRRSTKDRGLSDELNFLMCYDRTFVRALGDFIRT